MIEFLRFLLIRFDVTFIFDDGAYNAIISHKESCKILGAGRNESYHLALKNAVLSLINNDYDKVKRQQ